MANYIDNQSCGLYGTEYCKLLNMPGCENCAFGKLKSKEEVEGAMHDLDVLMSLVPEEGVAPLFQSESCLLCKGEANPRTCYAMTDIAHPEPARLRRNLIGIKTKCRVGSLLPVQISCCPRCRRNYFIAEYFQLLFSLLIALIALVVLSVRSVHEPLAAVSELLPFGVFAGAVLLGILLGAVFGGAVRRSLGRHTEFNIWALPLMKKLAALGWQPLTEGKNVSRLVFTRKRVTQGAYSSEHSKGKASI